MATKFFNKIQREFLQKGFGYTDRQMQIVELICAGTNHTGLSKILKITPLTAKTHVRNICRKAHSRGRADLILTLLHHSRHLSGLSALRLSKGLPRRISLGAKPGLPRRSSLRAKPPRPRRPARRSVSKVRRPLRKKARQPRRPVRRSLVRKRKSKARASRHLSKR